MLKENKKIELVDIIEQKSTTNIIQRIKKLIHNYLFNFSFNIVNSY